MELSQRGQREEGISGSGYSQAKAAEKEQGKEGVWR